MHPAGRRLYYFLIHQGSDDEPQATRLQAAAIVLLMLTPLISGDFTVATIQKLDADQEAEQRTILEHASELAQKQGLTVAESVRAYGVTAPEVVRIATERQVDQIAMGTRGMGAIGSVLLGSVAQRVLHLAEVPVLLVK